ncbi:biotin transporter BioY [Edaphobacter paludis]|uniref:Biotin transporter n=1 Tax=Edaphobacter paludis TaxID=3035702 RepID=A0AAU7D5A6_9BACT
MQPVTSSHSGLLEGAKPLHETLPGRIALSVAATLFVAACAHVSIPLFFTPVPITLQTFAVILIGMVLGPVAGFSTMVLYLAEGAMGLPVFSPAGPGGMAHLLGPDAGFLFAYPLAAAAAGWIVRAMPRVVSRFSSAILAGIGSSIITFALGAGWLAHLLHLGSTAVWSLAVAPFLAGEAIKITAAAGIFSSMQKWRRS